MNEINEALIYAAGLGTRMLDLTTHTPKPLLAFGRKRLIDHSTDLFDPSKFKKLHVNAAYLSEQIVGYYASSERVIVHEEPQGPYETGGTLKKLAARLPSAIFTMNSDVVFASSAGVGQLVQAWGEKFDALLLCVPLEKTKFHSGAGDFFIEDGVPLPRGNQERAPFVFTGLQIIRPKCALEFEEEKFSTRLIWDSARRNGRLGAIVFDDEWIDIGTKEALLNARRAYGD